MSNFENNKIFAAILCALIIIWISGFTADLLMHKDTHQEHAVPIDGAAHAATAVDTKPKLPDPIMALLAQADLEKGAKLSKQCASCHSFDKGGPVKQGPNLWNIVNAPKGRDANFSYCDTLENATGNWTYDSLNQFLTKPKKYISGTKMNYAGLKKPKDRAAIIGWLRTQAEAQAALPTEADINAEQERFMPKIEEIVPATVKGDNATDMMDKIEGAVEDAATIETPAHH